MKRILFAALLAIIVLLLKSPAQAKEREAVLENGTLVVKETTEVLRVPDVPKDLSADFALKLIAGEAKEVVIEDKVGRAYFSIAFPSVEARHEYAGDRIVRYRDGAWAVEQLPPKSSHGTETSIAILWLWMPALLIVMVSITSSLSGANVYKLLAVYGAMLVTAYVSAYLGAATMVLGMILGVASGILASRDPDDPSRLMGYGGGLAGAFVGGHAGFVVERSMKIPNVEAVMPYLFFLLAVSVMSFIIAKAIVYAKTRRLTTPTTN
ncbi:MAG: hypothetical protein WCT45_03105 [Candidatus Paceibacterota bacterium]